MAFLTGRRIIRRRAVQPGGILTARFPLAWPMCWTLALTMAENTKALCRSPSAILRDDLPLAQEKTGFKNYARHQARGLR